MENLNEEEWARLLDVAPQETESDPATHTARTPVVADVTIRVLQFRATPVQGQIIEVSRGGLKLALPHRLEPGTHVQVRLGRRIIMAEVRQCTAQEDLFHLNVNTTDVFWIPGAHSSDAAG